MLAIVRRMTMYCHGNVQRTHLHLGGKQVEVAPPRSVGILTRKKLLLLKVFP
jgi:hypothetical protein